MIHIAPKTFHPVTRAGQQLIAPNGHPPRFEIPSFSDFLSFLRIAELEEPEYRPDSRKRDRWLQKFWKIESITSGVINSAALIDANRGWFIVGGRNLVRKWTRKLKSSAGGKGWRHFVKKASLSFWTTDMGGIVGIDRDWPFATATKTDQGILITPSPLQSLENIDPAKCRLVSNLVSEPEELGFDIRYSLEYKGVPLFDWDYIRVAPLPNDSEEFNDLGYCALSRALELAKLLYGVFQHDQEKLGATMPKGLLILKNIQESQWEMAMEARKDKLSALERQFYGGLQILTSVAPDLDVDAKLIALSQLPDGMDQEKMINLWIIGMSLCFGYDPREFWPVSQGSLGTGRETLAQAEKATTKGGGDFRLSFQEQLQKEMPPTIHFEFDERDEAAEKQLIEIKKEKAEYIDILSKMREQTGGVLSDEQIILLLASEDLIPEEWTMFEELAKATDEDSGLVRQRLLMQPKVRAACERFTDEPIVRYHWPTGYEQVLWDNGHEALRRKSWPVLYEGDGWELTERDLLEAKNKA